MSRATLIIEIVFLSVAVQLIETEIYSTFSVLFVFHSLFNEAPLPHRLYRDLSDALCSASL